MKIRTLKLLVILFFYTSFSISAPPAPPPPGLPPPPGSPINSDISKLVVGGLLLGVFFIWKRKS
jgi:hypothetical protein